MLNTLRTLWFLLKIRMTTRGWFLTNSLRYSDGSTCPDKIIRCYGAEHLNCPIQALGVRLLSRKDLEKHHNIVFAADNQKAPWRKALLWATRLKEADAIKA